MEYFVSKTLTKSCTQIVRQTGKVRYRSRERERPAHVHVALTQNIVYSSDDSIYQNYGYIVFDINALYCIVENILNFPIYRDIFDNIAIFSTDSSLHCMNRKKDYKRGKLMLS